MNKKTGYARPTFGHKAKVVSLYFKALLTEREPIDLKTANKVRKWFHVPLDNIVLEKVYGHFGAELRMKKPLKLSHLRKRRYKKIQTLLRKKANSVGVPPIWYDDLWADRDEESNQ